MFTTSLAEAEGFGKNDSCEVRDLDGAWVLQRWMSHVPFHFAWFRMVSIYFPHGLSCF